MTPCGLLALLLEVRGCFVRFFAAEGGCRGCASNDWVSKRKGLLVWQVYSSCWV